MQRFARVVSILAAVLTISVFTISVFTMSGPAMPAHAETPADRAAIRAAIAGQIEAFRAADAVRAYSFATPAIQAIFGNPRVFMRMVRQSYRPVYRPRSFTFEAIREGDGRTIQPVRVIGPEGRAVVALYVMEQQPDGAWKIAGVRLVPVRDRAA